MNVNQIINMVVRMIMRRLIGQGVNAGMDFATNKMRRSGQGQAQGRPTNAADEHDKDRPRRG